MKKILIFLFLFLLLAGTASAWEWDNVYDYEKEGATATVSDSFFWFIKTDTIATIQLLSKQSVVWGEINPSDKEMIFEINLTLYEDYDNPLKKMETYLIDKDMRTTNKVYEYRQRVKVGEDNIYKKVCTAEKTLNSTGEYGQSCVNELVGTKDVYEYVEIDVANLKAGSYIIGGFADVRAGEHIEWIPTWFNVRITEWADFVGYTRYENLTQGLEATTNTNFDPERRLGQVFRVGYRGLNSSFILKGISFVPDFTGNFTEAKCIVTPAVSDYEPDMTQNLSLNDSIYNLSVISGSPANITMPNALLTQDTTYAMYCFGNDNGAIRRSDGTSPYNFSMVQSTSNPCCSWTNLSDVDPTNIYFDAWGEAETAPAVSLNDTPAEAANVLSPETLGGNSTDDLGLYNISLTLDGVINATDYNTTANQLSLNISRSLNIATGTYNWALIACDEDRCTATDNRSITISDFQENSKTYNTSTIETALESFDLNITFGTGVTDLDATLVYNGTAQTTTSAGTGTNRVFSSQFDIPATVGSIPFYWLLEKTNATGSFFQNSSFANVTVESASFGLCNSTLLTKYLNISFKDESTLAKINASIPTSSWSYYAGSGTVNKSLTFINTTENDEYNFCFGLQNKTLNVDAEFQYQSTGYPQRIVNPTTLEYTNVTTNSTLYLLATADGLYVTFQTVNAAEQPVAGAVVNGSRTLDGATVEIASGTTDAAGAVTFWLNPNFEHNFQFVATGFDTYVTSLFPTQTSYTIYLAGQAATVPDYGEGILFNITPSGGFVDQNQLYDFVYTISSDFWTLSSYNYSLFYGNDTIIDSQVGTTGTGGTLTTNNVNITSQNSIYMTYFYVANSTQTNGTRTWITQDPTLRGYSIWNFFNNLSTYIDAGFFGMDNFGKAIISFLIIVTVAGVLSLRYGINSEVAIIGFIFGAVMFLDVGIGLIPPIQIGGLTAIDNFLTFLTFIILIGFIIREEKR